MVNRAVHGHIHNYKDFTLVHGHLHPNQTHDNVDESFKHFEFINLKNSHANIPQSNHIDNASPQEYPSLKMLMEECQCDPQIIEICCDNSNHNPISHQVSNSDDEPPNKLQKKVTKNLNGLNSSQHSPNDLLFLDDCNVENKQLSKDVLVNFLDISKMYDIPVLNKTHGKIVHQENLLDVGFPKKESNLIEDDNHNHHHHKLELHNHGMHQQKINRGSFLSSIKDKIDEQKHSLNCQFQCESPPASVKLEHDNTQLDFKWNDIVSSNDKTTCKWEDCDKSFNSLMDLHSHLIFDHLETSKKMAENVQDLESNSANIANDERCFWDSCDFNYQNDCDLIDHINHTHGIQFDIGINQSDTLTSNDNLPIQQNDKFPCKWQDCNVVCKNEEELDNHIISHVPKRQAEYECSWHNCGKFFKQRQKLLRHLKSHSKYKGCLCEKCKKTFSTSDGLLFHRKKMHKNDSIQGQNTLIEQKSNDQ